MINQRSDHRESARPRPPVSPHQALATFEEVDIRCELRSRPHRPPNYEAEHRALAVLATEMAENPRNMLQKLALMAVDLCRADTAGISILEGDVFRWESLAGVFASRRNNTMPRQASPCGVCIEQNSTQLMYLADRCFPALLSEPRFVEALLVPFHYHGEPVGTVWIVAHNYERKFDREDERVVRTLACFAAAGWQLWKAYKTEAESNRNKDEFVAMLGHELRNPLAAILNAGDVLHKLGIEDPDAMQAVDIVARQAQHLSRMVDDLVDLSRIAHGKLTLHKERVELRVVIDHAVETTRAQIERRQHRISVKCPAEPIILDADPVRLSQLLSNLLDNAAKYTPNGGEISAAAELADDRVNITIGDTGIGIPKDQIDSIFELFTQLRGSQMTTSRGLGMGLALVRTLADLHGGAVEVVSAGPGQGSLFTVRLPISAKSSARNQPKPTTKPSVEPTVGRRILVVEDNEDIAESLGTLLAMDGHTVSIAQDGAVALDMLLTFDPEVVLLDIGLPGMDGYQVARRMRAKTGRSNLVIVALSGYGEERHRRQSIEAGCDDHLVKPVKPDFLRSFLARVGAASERS
jgi:signal transduction histidine kinase/ActR/RegA family two-component response regulator